jgi:hypothetical protein
MEEKNKKRSLAIWLVLIWQICAIAYALFSPNGLWRAFSLLFYGNHHILYTAYNIWTILTIIGIGIYFYELLKLKQGAIMWTDIVMGNSVLRGLVEIPINAAAGNKIGEGGTAFAIVVFILIWWAFRMHLKKIINNKSI